MTTPMPVEEFIGVLRPEYQDGARLLWDYLHPLADDSPWFLRIDQAYALRAANDSSGWEAMGLDLWFALDRDHPEKMPPLDDYWLGSVIPWVTGGVVMASMETQK
jgi:hypothetical protein